MDVISFLREREIFNVNTLCSLYKRQRLPTGSIQMFQSNMGYYFLAIWNGKEYVESNNTKSNVNVIITGD
jgi:hypothetical protein